MDFLELVEKTAELIRQYRESNPDAEIESDIDVLRELYDYARGW